MAHSQVRLMPQSRINLLHGETDSMAMIKTVAKIRDGAWGLAFSVYLAQKGVATV